MPEREALQEVLDALVHRAGDDLVDSSNLGAGIFGQTGEKHGWIKNRSPSSTINASNCRSASTRIGWSGAKPSTSRAITEYIMGG